MSRSARNMHTPETANFSPLNLQRHPLYLQRHYPTIPTSHLRTSTHAQCNIKFRNPKIRRLDQDAPRLLSYVRRGKRFADAKRRETWKLRCVVGGTCQGYEDSEISNAMPLSEVVKPLKERRKSLGLGFLRTRAYHRYFCEGAGRSPSDNACGKGHGREVTGLRVVCRA